VKWSKAFCSNVLFLRYNKTIIIDSDWRSEPINFYTPFQIVDLKVSIIVQDCQIANLNVSLCMCKQICEGSLVPYVMQ